MVKSIRDKRSRNSKSSFSEDSYDYQSKNKANKSKEDSTLTQMIKDAEEDLEMFDDCSFMDYDIEYTTQY